MKSERSVDEYEDEIPLDSPWQIQGEMMMNSEPDEMKKVRISRLSPSQNRKEYVSVRQSEIQLQQITDNMTEQPILVDPANENQVDQTIVPDSNKNMQAVSIILPTPDQVMTTGQKIKICLFSVLCLVIMAGVVIVIYKFSPRDTIKI